MDEEEEKKEGEDVSLSKKKDGVTPGSSSEEALKE